eukprot:1163510-Prorocentrum_minimum.AAC.1
MLGALGCVTPELLESTGNVPWFKDATTSEHYPLWYPRSVTRGPRMRTVLPMLQTTVYNHNQRKR